MKKFSLFIFGALFGFFIQDLASNPDYQSIAFTLIASILIIATYEIIVSIITSYKARLHRKVAKQKMFGRMDAIFENATVKTGMDMAGKGEDKCVVVNAHRGKGGEIVIDSVEGADKEDVETIKEMATKTIKEVARNEDENVFIKTKGISDEIVDVKRKKRTQKVLGKIKKIKRTKNGIVATGEFTKKGKEFKEKMDWSMKAEKFVFKSKLKSMTKKDLVKYVQKNGGKGFHQMAKDTRKDLIDLIVKNKFYKTRKKSDNPKK